MRTGTGGITVINSHPPVNHRPPLGNAPSPILPGPDLTRHNKCGRPSHVASISSECTHTQTARQGMLAAEVTYVSWRDPWAFTDGNSAVLFDDTMLSYCDKQYFEWPTPFRHLSVRVLLDSLSEICISAVSWPHYHLHCVVHVPTFPYTGDPPSLMVVTLRHTLTPSIMGLLCPCSLRSWTWLGEGSLYTSQKSETLWWSLKKRRVSSGLQACWQCEICHSFTRPISCYH